MRSSFIARNITAVFSGVVLTGLALTGAAYAITAATFTYAKPKIGFAMISPAAFVVEAPASTTYVNTGLSLDVTGNGCFVAPVNLPHGAKVTQLVMWYTKNDGVPESLTLSRSLPAAATSTQMARITVSNNTAGAIKVVATRITDPSLQPVNNGRFAYYLSVCLSDAQFFLGARIKYVYTSAGD